MFIRNKLLAWFMLLAVVVSACGPATTAAPTQPSDATQPPQPTSAAPVELTFWTWKVNHVPGLEAVAKNFEAQTGIKVTVTAVNPDDAYRTKLTTAAQSGELPDLLSYWTGGDDFWDKAASGTLMELTDKRDADWAN